VFVYQLERLDARKATTAERLIEQGIASGTACISFQVVQECLNTAALRKAQTPLSVDAMRKYLQAVLAPLYRLQPSVRLYHAALDIPLGLGRRQSRLASSTASKSISSAGSEQASACWKLTRFRSMAGSTIAFRVAPSLPSSLRK